MTTIIKHVHVLRDGVLHSFVPGDQLPEWAADVITNPDVLAEFPKPDGDAGDTGGEDSADTGGENSEDSGENPDGSGEQSESNDGSDSGSESDGDAGDTSETPPDREALVARAHELKIRLRKDMSDAEIAAVIAAKE